MNETKEPSNFSYPVEIDMIPEFEKLNDLKINIFELNDDNSVKILYNSYEKYKNVINLLLIHDNNENYHYVWIKDLNKLDKSNVATKCSMYRCEYCLSERFLTKEKLFNHVEKCKYNDSFIRGSLINEVLPEEGKNILKFKNINNKFMHPFYITADFESTLIKINDVNGDTTKYQKHVANSYGLKFNCIHDEFSKPVKIYNNSNPEMVCMNFIQDIEKYALDAYQLTQQNKENIIYSGDDKLKHKNVTKCSECQCKLHYKNKVAHHDHINGKFISSLCNDCNLLLRYKKFIPVYIHNLKGYDSHLFVSSLFKYGYQHKSSDNISCIPNNEEKYISFSKNIKVGEYIDKKTDEIKNVMYEIRFIDTFAFMSSSLESLSDNLRSEDELKLNIEVKLKDDKKIYEVINIDKSNITIKHENYVKIIHKDDIDKKYKTDINELRKIFKNTSEEFTDDYQFKLMIKKGVYPYDYIDNFNKLYESYLPDIN